jgi:hypothetical protein
MADVEADFDDWSATAGSNKPAGGTSIGTGLDDNLREIQAVTRKFLANVGTNVASGAALDLSSLDGSYVTVTGTTTITSISTRTAGVHVYLHFAGALTFTDDTAGGTLILPNGGSNITTAAGDVAKMVSLGSGNWKCVMYQPIDGQPMTAVDLTASVSGALPIGNGGTGQTGKTAGFDALSPLSAKGDLMWFDGSDNARMTTSAGGKFLISTLSGTSTASGTLIPVWGSGGKVIQVVNVQDGAVATGTTVMPRDDTIPQNTEGDEYMTLAITPSNASSTLIISVNAVVSPSASQHIEMALFQDATAGALAATGGVTHSAALVLNMSLVHKMTAGTTSATTFKIRIGTDSAGTTTFNGYGGARAFGGVAASSITIMEVLP